MERYLAIDNVCAWPNLTMMPDGRIVAAIFNQPCHGRCEGAVECWESRDEGRFWQRCGVPAPHAPGTNRMNIAAGLARNGDLIVISSGWSNRPPREKADPTTSGDATILPVWVCRSTDGGRTWSHTITFPPPEGESAVIPFGKILLLPDGDLAVSGYTSQRGPDSKDNAWCFRSSDDGRTWGDPILVAPGHNETDLLYLDGCRLLAAARARRHGGGVNLFASDDNGKKWEMQWPLTGPCAHPAHLLKLTDGCVLLTYGIRQQGFYGIGARLGRDNGKAWEMPIVLVDLDDASDGGYPSSVQLGDGSILTAYYANRVKAHSRYHMGIIHWNMQEASELNRKNR